jgi:hypothetical protein
MKIHEYYRTSANVNLNGSLVSLIPVFLIVIGNILFLQINEIMALIIPFLFYSFICIQAYLFRLDQSVKIEKSLQSSRQRYQTIFDANHLLVLFLNTSSPQLFLFFPDGQLAGELKKNNGKTSKMFKRITIFTLSNSENKILGYFKVSGRKSEKIEVFDEKKINLGHFKKQKQKVMGKGKKELYDATGRFVGAIEGSSYFMDEQIMSRCEQKVGRLRRGWMPLEWSNVFPEPNTPVLSFLDKLPEKNKLLSMSILINEFFIER